MASAAVQVRVQAPSYDGLLEVGRMWSDPLFSELQRQARHALLAPAVRPTQRPGQAARNSFSIPLCLQEYARYTSKGAEQVSYGDAKQPVR